MGFGKSWGWNLSVKVKSSKWFANQWMLPVWSGTREPEMCSISSSKLHSWINTKNFAQYTRLYSPYFSAPIAIENSTN